MDFQKTVKNLLFIDIETVSGESKFKFLSQKMQKLWLHKAKYLSNPMNMNDEEFYSNRAGIYAEFGKIVAIGVGFFHFNEEKEICLKVKSIYNDDEKYLLREFKTLIEKNYKPTALSFCAHNGKEFDYPYICRRMLINDITIPTALQLSGRKPWEIPHYDTLDMWKFGDKKHYTSLELMATIMGIECCKDDISGDQVNHIYYHEKNLPKIADYSREDVMVLAQLFLKFQSMNLVKSDNIERI